MAKDAQDREDLLREATALPRRVELRLPGVPQSVFCGFRDNGAFSLYWSPDEVFQFNTAHELRRAFWKDRLVASYKHVLHWLEPGDGGRVRLARRAFEDAERSQLIEVVTTRLNELGKAIASDSLEVIGVVPEDENVISQVRDWLHKHGQEIRFALHPGVGT